MTILEIWNSISNIIVFLVSASIVSSLAVFYIENKKAYKE